MGLIMIMAVIVLLSRRIVLRLAISQSPPSCLSHVLVPLEQNALQGAAPRVPVAMMLELIMEGHKDPRGKMV